MHTYIYIYIYIYILEIFIKKIVTQTSAHSEP